MFQVIVHNKGKGQPLEHQPPLPPPPISLAEVAENLQAIDVGDPNTIIEDDENT